MRLYKYVSPERGLDVLSNLLIRFTQPTAQNDPFEFRPLVAGFLRPDAATKFVAEEFEKQLPAEIAKYQAVLGPNDKAMLPIIAGLKPALVALAIDQIDAIFPTLKELLFQKLDKALGILSLTEAPSDLLMWAHYAASHSGFVVEFDGMHPWFWGKLADTDEFRHLRKVTYIEQPLSLYLSDWDGQDVFYSKLKNWAYEQEWRVIRPLQEAAKRVGDDVYLFDVPPESIRGVVSGIKTSPAAWARLCAILKANPKLRHVSTFQARLAAGTNAVEIHPAT